MATADSPSQLVPRTETETETEMDEARIVASLARLQEMHVALRNLRETIPRVVESVLIQPAQPDNLHLHFKEAATGAAEDIKDFAQLMGHSRNKEVLEKAKESRAKKPDGISPWLVTEHPDWLDVKKEDISDDVDIAGTEEIMKTSSTDDKMGDIKAALDKLEKSYKGILTVFKPEMQSMIVNLASPANIAFTVDFDTSAEDITTTYKVGCLTETKMNKVIVEAIASRPRPNDLNSLLDMLASYLDIKSRACLKCSRLLDRNAQFPVIRSRKRIKQPDGHYMTQWQSLHNGCF